MASAQDYAGSNVIRFCAPVQIHDVSCGPSNARNWYVSVQHDASFINLQFGLVDMQDEKKVPRQKNRGPGFVMA